MILIILIKKSKNIKNCYLKIKTIIIKMIILIIIINDIQRLFSSIQTKFQKYYFINSDISYVI